MEELDLKNYQEFADRFSIGRSTMYELLRGRSRTRGAYVYPNAQTMIALAGALQRPLHEIIYYILPDAPGADLFVPGSADAPRQIAVQIAGWCGAGPEQEILVGDEQVFVSADFARNRDLVAFEVHGDSMDAGKYPIHHLDIVLVDRGDPGHDGAAVVARLESGYVCKLLKDDKFGRNLYSRNADYTNGTPPAIPVDNHVEIVGRVVQTIARTPDPSPTS